MNVHPRQHKTGYRGKTRRVKIGPQAQAVLAPFMATATDPTATLFFPATTQTERFAAMRAARKSPVQPSQADRSKAAPERPPGDSYTRHSYAKAVARGAKLAGVHHWHPNQLRHSHATEVRKRYGLEAAGASLGHAKMSATEVYAERDEMLAERSAAELG